MPDSGTADSGVPDAGPLCELHVSAIETRFGSSSAFSAPRVFTPSDLRVWHSAVDGGWLEGSVVTGSATENLVIPLACGGSFALQDQMAFVPIEFDRGGAADSVIVTGPVQPITEIDLSHAVVGHRDLPSVMPAGTLLDLHLDGLQPTDPYCCDTVSLFSPELGAQSLDVLYWSDVPGGTTSYSGTRDVSNLYLKTYDADAGDETIAVQWQGFTDSSSTYDYFAIDAAGPLPGFTMIPGTTSTVSTTLAPLARDQQLSFTMDYAAFAAIYPQMNPTAQVNATNPLGEMSVGTVPSLTPRYAWTGWNPNVASESYQLDYAKLYPQRQAEFGVSETLVADAGIPVYVHLWSEYPVEAVPTTIAPQLGPVQVPLLNGQDAFQRQSGVGSTPTLSWSPPSLGTATIYRIEIMDISAGFENPVQSPLYTTDSHITLLPDMLMGGRSYVALITAISSASRSATAPVQHGLPEFGTDVITAPFSP